MHMSHVTRDLKRIFSYVRDRSTNHSSNMASTRTEDSAFTMDIHITRLEDSSPVFFKIDGERFKETQTLKLQVDTSYKLSFEFRPSREAR